MAVTDFIAAIELGSTHITGIAGKKNADGSIHIPEPLRMYMGGKDKIQ